jgi:hypothetical protein
MRLLGGVKVAETDASVPLRLQDINKPNNAGDHVETHRKTTAPGTMLENV